MKITVRLTVSLLIAAALVSSVFSYLQVQSERETLIQELNVRANVLGESLQESIKNYLQANATVKLKRMVERFGNRARLIGIAVYDSQGVGIVTSPALQSVFQITPPKVWESISRNEKTSGIEQINGKAVHLYVIPFDEESRVLGALLLYHDASFIDTRLEGIWRTNFFRLMMHFFLIIITTVLVVRWSITGPIAQIAKWMHSLRTGKAAATIDLPRGDLLRPLAAEVALLAKSLAHARSSAEEEARLRIEAESLWTSERLKEHVKIELNGKNLFVVSNREPYMHMNVGNSIQCIVPAGGLVTALDPIMRACGGIWIAHGSGTADRETVDARNMIPVPPDEPAYKLRRVFLSKEEEEGYYYGFSNEGIWPLCHITHTRPTFGLQDWIQYQKVNQKFADALLEEISGEEAPLVLIQDYHFALLPLLIKSKRPDARVAIFWHTPWPNPEVFGICPWKQELLLGLLGADLIGFHIQFHCNNFLETVDRFLESKINWDQFSVERHGQLTSVRPFPISVAHPFETEISGAPLSSNATKETLLKKFGLSASFMAIGVDRIDYTKGIVERFQAVQRFLEKYPEYIGRFTFVELGAPSRTHIKRYHDLIAELDESADKINWSFQAKNWKPIIFLKAHHDHKTIGEYYRAADVCMVTSLHDGMNLVAKEFIATRTDGDGVLILSQFTGASRELPDSLIVNPYDIEETAEAIHQALKMEKSERRERMQEMRTVVKERNVYRWAANIITTLSHLRMPKQAPQEQT
ncbi:MAG: trehalose-6-phosphate synthase [Ignavibacteriae bacterium]|nr:MAG: trehalose-6-phosphate synthase [Ignavibacteriota bacterium]